MIRPRGVALVITAVGVLLLAGTSRIGWVLLFDSLLWGIVVISAAMPWLTTGNLRISRRVTGWENLEGSPGPTEGEVVQFEVMVHNNGMLPAIFVGVRPGYGGKAVGTSRDRLFITWLGRGQDFTAASNVIFDRRGMYELVPAAVESGAPFGLFRRLKRVGTPGQLLVFPKVHPLSGWKMLGSTSGAETQPLPARVGEQVAGSREYAPGDPWLNVHWRNTARTGKLQVKEYEKEPDKALSIVFEASEACKPGNEALEDAIRLAASVGSFLCSSGGIVRLVAGLLDKVFTSRDLLLKELALLQPTGGRTLLQSLRQLPPGTDLLVIAQASDAEADAAVNALAVLRRKNQVAVVILRHLSSESQMPQFLGALHRAAIMAVECWPGGVPDALAALGAANSTPGQQHALLRPANVPKSH